MRGDAETHFIVCGTDNVNFYPVELFYELLVYDLFGRPIGNNPPVFQGKNFVRAYKGLVRIMGGLYYGVPAAGELAHLFYYRSQG